jgi:hypothetical protein
MATPNPPVILPPFINDYPIAAFERRIALP